jgi:hypothetical protein
MGHDAAGFGGALHDKLPNAGVDVLESDFAVTRVVTANGPEFHRCREIFAASCTEAG